MENWAKVHRRDLEGLEGLSVSWEGIVASYAPYDYFPSKRTLNKVKNLQWT